MNKSDFVKAVATKSGLSQKDTRVVLDAIQDVVYEALGNEDKVAIMNGLTVTTVVKEPRMSRNPHTGEAIEVPRKRVPKVKIGKGLKEAAAFA